MDSYKNTALSGLLTRSSKSIRLTCTTEAPTDDVTRCFKVQVEQSNPSAYAELLLTVPRLEDDTNIFMRKALYYAAVYHARRPLLSMEPESNCFVYKRENVGDIVFRLGRNNNPIAIFSGKTIVGITDMSDVQRFSIALMPEDRAYFNDITGAKGSELHLTSEDIKVMVPILRSQLGLQGSRWQDPDHIDNLMVEDLDRSIARIFLEYFEMVCGGVRYRKSANQELWNRVFDRWMYSDRFLQYIGYPSGIAKTAWTHKVILPETGASIYDRPHPSWRGYIDVLSTPMSEKAGIIVSLADGAYVEGGRIKGTRESMYSPQLRRTLLFPDMIRGPRIVLHANTVRQSCSLRSDDGVSNNDAMLMIPAGSKHIPQPHGMYLQTAIMNWNGLTHEDACVLSRSAADKLTTVMTIREIFSVGGTGSRIPWEVGSYVEPHDAIIYVTSEDEEEEAPRLSGKLRNPATITDIQIKSEMIDDTMVKHYVVTFESEYPCHPGSKLCGMHSNKHIISAILPDSQMPATPNGVHVDIVISPYTIGERMAPSLMLEGMLNLVITQGRKRAAKNPKLLEEISQFDSELVHVLTTDPIEIVPFEKEPLNKRNRRWTFDKVASWLEILGIGENATETLESTAIGRSLTIKHKYPNVFCTPLFFMRLHHHPEDKLRYNSKIVVNPSGMPIAGQGNVRLTREELEVFCAVNSTGLYKEYMGNIPAQATHHLKNIRIALGGADYD